MFSVSPSSSVRLFSEKRPNAEVLFAGVRQQGQVLVIGVIVAGAVALAFLRYFDVGVVVSEKARQDHVLDAAAYSGALIQARSLNMLAYIQRAQAAHQVAMAHLVTLGSLAHFAGMEAVRAGMSNPPASVIGMHFGPEHMAAYLAALQAVGLDYQASTHGPLAAAYAQHDHLARSVLTSAAAQITSHIVESRNNAIREVLNANYPSEDHFDFNVIEDTLPRFLGQQAANPFMLPFLRELSGLYSFLGPRNHTDRSLLPVSSRCPWRRHEIRRRGATQLDGDGIWQSVDSQSYHALRSNRWIGCYYREYPMAWGWILPEAARPTGIEYVEDAPWNFSEQDFWRWVRASTPWNITSGGSNPLANSWAHTQRQAWQGGGLPPFYDLSVPRSVPAHFTVKLRRIGRNSQPLYSRSAAEAYFRRPYPRQDGHRELPNVFHPYWQARLRASAESSEKKQ